MNLNTEEWKEFFVKDLFIIDMGNKFDKNKMTTQKPSVNFISRTGSNNGLDLKVDLVEDVLPYKEGSITLALGGSTGACYFQPKPFYTGQNVAVLIEKTPISVYAKLFITCLIMNECKYKFIAFGRELNTHIKRDFSIFLPVCYETSNDGNKTLRLDNKYTYSSDGYIPDFIFMEKYIKSLNSKPVTTNIKKNSSLLKINTDGWHEFILSDIFDIKKGKRLTKADQTDGKTPYIGATDSNNGLANYIGQQPLHDGNTITLSYNGSVGEAFYQPVPFWATDDVNVLYFKKENGVEFNKYIALFICTILKKEKYRYSYGRKWTLENMKSSIIRLPSVLKNDEFFPDFEYMEKYIKQLYYSDRIL